MVPVSGAGVACASHPLWDPNHWGGQPLVGQAQPGAVYPLKWILFLLTLKSGHVSISILNWYLVAIHFLGAVFAYLLAGSCGARGARRCWGERRSRSAGTWAGRSGRR